MSKKKSVLAQYRKRSRFGEFWYRLRQNKGAMVALVILAILIFFALFADVVFDYRTDIATMNIRNKLQKPFVSWDHILGTDNSGRDILKRVLYGTKYSMSISAMVVLVTMVLGIPIGTICGYYGGKVDLYVMRIFNVIGSIPGLLMGVLVVAALGQSTMTLVVAIAISGIGGTASVTRASMMTVRNMEYVESARAMGQKELYIAFKQCLPNCLAPIIVNMTLKMGGAIISASSLSFLGLGVKIPLPEWGAMLNDGKGLVQAAPFVTVWPGLAIMITVLAFNMLGDGIRDALDPKLKK